MTSPGQRPICLFGAGEHARVVAEAVVRGGRHVAGCWSPTGPAASTGMHWLGDDARLAAEVARWADAEFHVAFVGKPGGTSARRELYLRERGRAWGTIVHPDACVSRSAELGPGTFVGAEAVVQAGARLGMHAVVNTAAVVEHDVEVGEGSHLATGAIVGGGARIGAWCWIGLGARIRDHVQIGDGAIVAMGAVVVADVAAGTTVIGIPARAKP